MLQIDWHLTNRCNFDCEYCHPQIKRVLNRQHLTEPPADLAVQRFNELGVELLVHMSGGEPFLYPDFVRLCKGLTERHSISINTNLSTDNVKEFAEKIDPAGVKFIMAATHIVERLEKGHTLDKYAENFRYLSDRGFPVTALYIMYPPLLERCGGDIAELSKLGVAPIIAKVFKGVYQHQRYPDSYTDREKETVRKFAGKYKFNDAYLAGQLSFTGLPCNAGCTSVKVNVTGDVQRCASVKASYGNLYEGTFMPANGPSPCTAHRVLAVSQCHEALVNSPIAVESDATH